MTAEKMYQKAQMDEITHKKGKKRNLNVQSKGREKRKERKKRDEK